MTTIKLLRNFEYYGKYYTWKNFNKYIVVHNDKIIKQIEKYH